MISYFKKRSLLSAIKSHPNQSYKPETKVYNRGERVGIISDIIYRNDVKHFINASLGKIIVKTIYYSDEKVEVEDPQIYGKRDLNWAGVPCGAAVEDFLSNEYDRLYYFDVKMDVHQMYIYQVAKSLFSIGPLLPDNPEHFDLSIELPELTVKSLISEVKKGLDLLSHIP